VKLIEIIPAQNTVGEGIVWDADTQCLWWTDIEDSCLYRCPWPVSYAPQTYELPERLGSFGLCPDGTTLIAAFESGIALYDTEHGASEWLMRLPPREAPIRFNDGRVDRQGRFWAGTMVEHGGTAPIGELFCVMERLVIEKREQGIIISNGACWSPRSDLFYFADSPRRQIYAYDFDAASGQISNRRVFATTPKGIVPDGADVDAGGFLWSAQWGGSRVVRYRPDGEIDRILKVPASQPTSIAFGGPRLDLLFVTSAREGLSETQLLSEPHAGDIFVYQADICGLPNPKFVGWSHRPKDAK
jgi:sugar lactone lactonase YvrE